MFTWQKILMGVVIFFALFRFVFLLSGDEKIIQSNNVGTPSNKQQQPADPIVITVDKLVGDLNKNALKASETYKGAYIEVTGRLSTIDSNGKYFSLAPLNRSFTSFTVLCRITEEHKSAAPNFESKQLLTVIGTVIDVGETLGYILKVESIYLLLTPA